MGNSTTTVYSTSTGKMLQILYGHNPAKGNERVRILFYQVDYSKVFSSHRLVPLTVEK